MRNIVLTTYVDADLDVSNRHFGGNILYTRNTDNGTPDPNFVAAADDLDIQYIRYPAGQPDVAYIDGVIVDGYLPDHLIDFLENARANNWQVLIVTPTHEAYPGAEAIGEFAHLLARDYRDVVHAFEIGNEYWNHQTETSYGQVANDSVLAISDALEVVGANLPIWVQMGDAGGWQSEFHIRNDDRGWVTRTVDANDTIIDQISSEAFAEIDGVVEHFYLRGGEQYINVAHPNDQMISLDWSIWQNYLHEDATLNITEWNVRSSNLDQLGIRAASSLVAHFSHIVELGADEAYLWPPHLNTSSDLAGSNEVIVDSETGIVINSVGGAIFDMMSTSLPGLEYLPSGVRGESSSVIHHLYASNERVVVYLSSRSEEVEIVNYSLGEFFEGFSLASARRVGYDHSTSDARHYNYRTRSWDDSTIITVQGEEYVINEHDVRASIDVLDVTNVNPFDSFVFELLPYQVMELVYEIPVYNILQGTLGRDVMSGTDSADWVFLDTGDDSIAAGGGSDTIHGGLGNDYINSGAGNDSVDGGDGNDSLRGWGGDDSLLGGAGDDNIQGSFGRDSLDGGLGHDALFGGDWHDTLSGGAGDDSLCGGEGNDVLMGGAGDDLLLTGQGQDTVFGGTGYDTLSLAESVESVSIWSFHQIAEFDDRRISFAEVEVIEATNFADGISVAIDRTTFSGLAGADSFSILQGEGNVLYGGSGNDSFYLFSGAGNLLSGGAGADSFFAYGEGNMFAGGQGDDEFLFFNQSSDTLVYREGDGDDMVRGFNINQDEIHIGQELASQTSIISAHGISQILFDGGGSIEFFTQQAITIDDIEFI